MALISFVKFFYVSRFLLYSGSKFWRKKRENGNGENQFLMAFCFPYCIFYLFFFALWFPKKSFITVFRGVHTSSSLLFSLWWKFWSFINWQIWGPVNISYLNFAKIDFKMTIKNPSPFLFITLTKFFIKPSLVCTRDKMCLWDLGSCFTFDFLGTNFILIWVVVYH